MSVNKISGMKISIVTVCYNSASTIADTLRSVSNQTYKHIEHLVVDGKSNDETIKVIEVNRHPALILSSEADDGIYDAMNKGIAWATGDVIGFINADDFYPSPYVLAIVADAFESSGADCCYGDLCYLQKDNISKTVRYWRSSPFELGLFGKGWCPPHPTFFVRREVYERLGGFNLSYKIAADVELMARFLEVGHISSHYIPQVLVHMRMGGTTNRNLGNVVKQNLEIRRGLLALGMGFSWALFLGNKMLSRVLQFVRRPA
jgi:glycosyltransferase involved in cell wall biosynthesis